MIPEHREHRDRAQTLDVREEGAIRLALRQIRIGDGAGPPGMASAEEREDGVPAQPYRTCRNVDPGLPTCSRFERHDRRVQVWPDFALIDFGGGARLERFGDRVVDRPHPAALGPRREAGAWTDADLRFERDRGWTGPAANNGAWPVALDGLSLELRPTDAGQLGLFPEHLAMLPWLRTRVMEHAAGPTSTAPRVPAVLHLFAYTGLATLAMAAAGAAVAHVDSSRPTVAWARKNAARSSMDARPIRWMVDDALAFAKREARRGRRYAGLVLDPPTYGHGPGGRAWQFEEHLAPLLEAGAAVLESGGFVLTTAHTPGFDGDRLAAELGRALTRKPGTFERGELAISTGDGRRLELGAFARWPSGAS